MFYNTKKYNTGDRTNQGFVRDFQGFKGRVVYGSSEYHDIMFKKVFYSIRGYRSHPILFDIMIRNGENLYLGNRQVKVNLENNKEL